MLRLNSDWVRAISGTANNCPYFQLQAMTIVDLGPGSSHIEIELGERHLQPLGQVHGGVYSSLIDACGWWALYTQVDDGIGMTTLEMKLNFLAPTNQGKLIGRGTAIKMGKNIGLADARIEDETGRLLAHGTVTGMALSGLKFQDQDKAPPKFIT